MTTRSGFTRGSVSSSADPGQSWPHRPPDVRTITLSVCDPLRSESYLDSVPSRRTHVDLQVATRVRPPPLLVAQRLDGIEPRRAQRGQQAERDADGRAEHQADDGPLERDVGV